MKDTGRSQNFMRIGIEVMVILAVLLTIGYLVSVSEANHVFVYDDGWTVRQDGDIYDNVELSQYEFEHILNKGDTIMFENTLPEGIARRSSLALLVYLSTVDVFVDGSQVYSYGHDIEKSGKMVGSGYHFVQLPEDSSGKQVVIVIRSCEDNSFSSIPAIEIMESQFLLASFARQHALVLFVSVFLLVLGILLMLGTLVGVVRQNGLRQLVWIGTFSFLMGAWSLCNTKTIQVFSMNLALNTQIEYVALFLAVIPLVLQVYYMRADSPLFKRVLLGVCVALSVVYACVAWVLHALDIAHFCATLGIFHLVLVFDLIVVILVAWKPFRHMSASDKVLNIGFLVMFITGGVDLVRFVLQKYLFTNDQNLSNSVLPLGTMVFIVMLLVSYLFFTYNNILEEENRKTLTRLAYHDNLTGLLNRTKCDELFERLDKGREDYIIVNIDLNGLKKINDTYGHAQGDLLIKTFADNMKKAFAENLRLIRMGGDEFVIIGKEGDRSSIQHGFSRLEGYNKEASKKLPFEIKAAYGIAGSLELPSGNAEKVYHLADERMYEMKVEMKMER